MVWLKTVEAPPPKSLEDWQGPREIRLSQVAAERSDASPRLCSALISVGKLIKY